MVMEGKCHAGGVDLFRCLTESVELLTGGRKVGHAAKAADTDLGSTEEAVLRDHLVGLPDDAVGRGVGAGNGKAEFLRGGCDLLGGDPRADPRDLDGVIADLLEAAAGLSETDSILAYVANRLKLGTKLHDNYLVIFILQGNIPLHTNYTESTKKFPLSKLSKLLQILPLCGRMELSYM